MTSFTKMLAAVLTGLREDGRLKKEQGGKVAMGHLIPMGLPNQGHSIDFKNLGVGEAEKCFMVCECGWEIEIESFRHPWSLIETRVRLQRHMKEFGLESNE